MVEDRANSPVERAVEVNLEQKLRPNRPARRLTGRWTTLLVLLPACLLFVLGAVSDITVPGLYMDAVNPDYLVVRLLEQSAATPAWVLPGTLLFGLFPVLGQIYHGALPYWLGLPSYALFGTGIIGIRLTNMLFGLLVLVAAGLFLRAFRVSPILTAFVLAALGLDPGFLFTFRTQFYITVLPLASLLIAIAWAEYRHLTPTPKLALGIGVLAGVAFYGYFIYAFLVPAVALHAGLRWWASPRWWRLVGAWATGLLIGSLPYPLGMLLILAATGGPHGFMAFINANLGSLSVGQSSLSFVGRLTYFKDMLFWTISDVGPVSMMLHRQLPPSLPTMKLLCLLVLPALATIAALFRPSRYPGLLVLTGLTLGTAILFTAFGNRLWLHHAAPLLPVLYLALALGLDMVGRSRTALIASIIILAPLLAGNVIDRQVILFELDLTGGVGLASDALERFSTDAVRNTAPTHAFFPDWGIFMPFIMVSDGRIPLTTDFKPAAAQQVLCSGQDALLAVMDDKGLMRLGPWIASVGWGQPETIHYRQRNGVPVLTALRWHASATPHKSCQLGQ